MKNSQKIWSRRIFQILLLPYVKGPRKPVFGVSEEVRFKPTCSAIETRQKIEIALVSSLDMILSNK